MPNPWFRLYSEFADDPKVQMMTEVMQRRLIMLFCSRCKEEKLQESQRAFHWRITEKELSETKAVFMENGFIDANWNLTNWNKRQFLSDSSTERTRQYRQRLKHGETSHETSQPVTVTAPDTDTDTEQNRTEQRQIQKKLAPRSSAPPKKRGGELAPISSIFSTIISTSPTLPKNRAEMIAGGYVFSNRAACKGCGEEIEWWTSPKGARLPMNITSNAINGAIVHMETCPNCTEYRKVH